MKFISGECIRCENVNGDRVLNRHKCRQTCKVYQDIFGTRDSAYFAWLEGKSVDIDDKIGEQALQLKQKTIEQIEKECGVKRR